MEAVGASQRAEHERPLVVDLSSILLRSDGMIELFFGLLASRPLRAFAAMGALASGKKAFEERLVANTIANDDVAPLNDGLVDFIREERAKSRKVYLTGLDGCHANGVAATLGIFDGVVVAKDLGDGGSAAKAAALCAMFGESGFDYADNTCTGLTVRRMASASQEQRCRLSEAGGVQKPRARPEDFTRALRIHQWLKNTLIFVPALAAHQFHLATFLLLLVAFVSFGCAASSAYLLNDLLDLRSDRNHPTKRYRPIASGRFPLKLALTLVPVLLVAAFVLSIFLPLEFALSLGTYCLVTFAYSVYIKRRIHADVLTLACLYGLRLIAGGAAVGVTLSPWLMAFATFLFLSLAIVKRCTELMDRGDGRQFSGRSYIPHDLPVLEAMAVASGYVAVMVFALYLNSSTVVELYRHPQWLWLICIIMLYWLSRLFVLMHRGELEEDPIVFAMSDRASLASAVGIAAVVAMSL